MSANDFNQSQPQTKNYNRQTFFILGGCFALFLCSICAFGLAAVGFVYYEENIASGDDVALTTPVRVEPFPEKTAVSPTNTPLPQTKNGDPAPTLPPATVPPTVPPQQDIGAPSNIEQRPIPPRAYADLERLIAADFPSNNPYELGIRLGQFNLGERVVPGSKYEVGDVESFFNDEEVVEAVLLAKTEHACFWVETSLNLDQTAVSQAAERFEAQYYERTVNLFGEYWIPGVDADPRFTVLHVEAAADGELGYFSDIDQYPQSLFDTSNEQELIYISLENMDLGDDLYFGTLVHEFQHMIQWHIDPSEERWLNEGLSQLAELVNLLETVDTVDYLEKTEVPLNRWDFEDQGNTFVHYASSYLFMVYFWEQLGTVATQELSRHPANGMASVQQLLATYMPETTLTQFVGNWAAANYLDDIISGSVYYYDSLDFKKPTFQDKATELPAVFEENLDQFGVHYIDLLDLRGPVQIRFAGDTVQEIANPPVSGEQMWFAPGRDEVNARLTAVFDLTQLSTATLNYKLWYELETDYDYAYISISTDGGSTWNVLTTNVTVNAEYGEAYNGYSADEEDSGWLDQSISLNHYVGQQVLIRFETISDFGISERGIAIDDISVPELNGYFLDVEGDTTGWQPNGFVPIGHLLPQQWSVQLIQDGPEPTVTNIPLDAFNQGVLDVEIGKGGGVLVIVPTTPFTNNAARYWVEITKTGD